MNLHIVRVRSADERAASGDGARDELLQPVLVDPRALRGGALELPTDAPDDGDGGGRAAEQNRAEPDACDQVARPRGSRAGHGAREGDNGRDGGRGGRQRRASHAALLALLVRSRLVQCHWDAQRSWA